PRKQARRLVPSGTCIRHWIPELASLPPAELFEPDRAQQRAQLALPLGDALQYPPPIIDHDAVARQFLARYSEFTRRSAGRWASADRASR
ncbi:MAG: deoxyribodipyrimidine photolyase, partial [Candidatus Eremiobacteraeota bacterium]|nr:deoxyribodipyrimidine photolyase [Candidatus Eremiobacteraeota bacterium]